MGLGLTFGVDGEKRFRQSENHSEAVFISIAEEQHSFINSEILPKKLKHYLRLDGLGSCFIKCSMQFVKIRWKNKGGK